MNIRFDHLEYLGLLWLAVAMVGFSIYAFAKKRKALALFASAELHRRLTARVSRGRQWLKAIVFIAGVVFTIAALVGPRWGSYWKEVHRRGRDIVIVLDLSRSMLAVDGGEVKSRLELAKDGIRNLVDEIRAGHGDRVALVTFAGNSSVKCPLTLDYAFFSRMLDDAAPGSQAQGGTLMGDAIRKAASVFDDKLKNYNDMILITDGEDHDSYPLDAASKAWETKGTAIYTVGLGSAAGSKVPAGNGSWVEYEGQPVISKLGESTLRQIALNTHAAYVPPHLASRLQEVYREKITVKEGRETEQTRREWYTSRYQWFLVVAFALLAVEPLVSERKRK